MDTRPELKSDDYADAAESAQRGNAWPQAAALWRRAAATAPDAEQAAKYEKQARWCDDMPGIAGRTA